MSTATANPQEARVLSLWEGKVEGPGGEPLPVVRFDLVTFLMWFERAEMGLSATRDQLSNLVIPMD